MGYPVEFCHYQRSEGVVPVKKCMRRRLGRAVIPCGSIRTMGVTDRLPGRCEGVLAGGYHEFCRDSPVEQPT